MGRTLVTSATIERLTPNARYEVRVTVTDSVGSSGWSPTGDDRNLRTAANAPPTVENAIPD